MKKKLEKSPQKIINLTSMNIIQRHILYRMLGASGGEPGSSRQASGSPQCNNATVVEIPGGNNPAGSSSSNSNEDSAADARHRLRDSDFRASAEKET